MTPSSNPSGRTPRLAATTPWGKRIATMVLASTLLAAGCGDTALEDASPGISPGDVVQPVGQVQFTDVAGEVGLDVRHGAFQWSTSADPLAMMGAGVCWIDYDSDGWLDLFVVNTWSDGEWHRWQDEGGLPTSRMFRNEEGAFRDVGADTGTAHEIRGNGCVAADLDLDGFTDLYVTTERANLLLWNESGEGFTLDDGSAGADAYGWHTGAAVGDVNGDGWPDLFVAGYADAARPIPEATRGFPNTIEPEPDLLLLSQGGSDGERPRFVDVASEAGVEPNLIDYGLGVVMSDVDGDGDLDLYVANDTQPNRLYVNTANATGLGFEFIDVAADAGVGDDDAGMGLASGDYDGDGRPDLVVTNMATQGHNVFTSNGPTAAAPAFAADLSPLGLSEIGQTYTGWGTTWADFDLDGLLDLAIAHGAIPVADLEADRQPLEIFLQQVPERGETFAKIDATPAAGGEAVYLARGLASADYDNDGDVDLAIASIGGDVGLLRNDGVRSGWLTVLADPPTPGTVITVAGPDGTVQNRQIVAGSSYLSSEDPRAHFGFDVSVETVTVEVRWPDGATSSVVVDELDSRIVVQP